MSTDRISIILGFIFISSWLFFTCGTERRACISSPGSPTAACLEALRDPEDLRKIRDALKAIE